MSLSRLDMTSSRHCFWKVLQMSVSIETVVHLPSSSINKAWQSISPDLMLLPANVCEGSCTAARNFWLYTHPGHIPALAIYENAESGEPTGRRLYLLALPSDMQVRANGIIQTYSLPTPAYTRAPASHDTLNSHFSTMARKLLLLLSFALSPLACQRDLLNREPSHNTPLTSRQVATFPPQWTPEERILHTSFSRTSLDTWSSYYTSGNHIAGLNKSMAEATAKQWTANGVPSQLVEYEIYLDYPKEQALMLKWNNGSTYEAQLWEDVLGVDGTTGAEGWTGAWHGYSKSGKVEAEYVYVG